LKASIRSPPATPRCRPARSVDEARRVTFAAAARAYIAAHAPSWRSARHGAQWRSTIETYVLPVIGDMPVADVAVGDVLRVLEPVWQRKPETASRIRNRIELVIDWAVARGYRTAENPARWRGRLAMLLPTPRKIHRVTHFAAVAYDALPAVPATIRQQPGVAARALEFLVLTAARAGETIGATWDEIDLKAAVWTIPGSRTKSGREHRVPLSDRALAILEELPRVEGNRYLFIGARRGHALSDQSMRRLLQAVAPDATVHGFRSSFADWASEQTAFARETIEAALSHAVGDSTERAYRRGDVIEKRRRLMAAWADYCGRPPASGDVVPMQRVAHR
jgi:integrase